ncbi:MAG: hypothetical protein J6S19_07805, partial [Lentisphaeria bacterium]|nr:hypothetical protein [Lentisphaeria bacterium]
MRTDWINVPKKGLWSITNPINPYNFRKFRQDTRFRTVNMHGLTKRPANNMFFSVRTLVSAAAAVVTALVAAIFTVMMIAVE